MIGTKARGVMAAVGVLMGAAAPGIAAPPAAQAGTRGKSSAVSAAVTGTLTVEGKPIALHHAIAVRHPDDFDDTKEAFAVALTAEPLSFDPLPMQSAGDRLQLAVTAGVFLDVSHRDYGWVCTAIVRDPVLGGRELHNMGGACNSDSITTFGPKRVTGRITSSGGGGEETFGSSKLAFVLQFDVPVLTSGQAAAPGGHR